MVKGISQQAVVVNPPENSPFRQAIFLLSQEQSSEALGSPQALLELAEKLTAAYTVQPAGKRKHLPAAFRYGIAFFAGMALMSGVWLGAYLLAG